MAKKGLLYITYTLPEYNVATGDRHATGMLEELGRDFDIHLAAACCTAPEYYSHPVSRYAARVYVGNLHTTLERLAEGNLDIAIVMFERVGLRHLFSLAKLCFPRAKTAVSAIDIEYRREYGIAAMAKRYGIDPRTLSLLAPDPDTTKKLELGLYRKADFVITVSGDDRDFLVRDGIPSRKIFVCRLSQPLADASYNPEGRYLTFVGYAKHVPNYVSMKAFIDTVFPHLKNYLEKNSYRIAIVGGDRNSLYHGLERGSLVEVPGHLDIAEIRARYYVNTSLSLAPLVAGSGVKGKILEAMAHRLPVVTTDVGLQGLEEFRDCVIRIDMDDPRGAAETILRYLGDRGARMELSERAAGRLAEYNSSDENFSSLRTRLDLIARAPEPAGIAHRLRRDLEPWRWWFLR